MFLFERLVGVGIYSAILVAVCYSISRFKSNKSVRIVLFVYTIALALMGFFYVPYKTADLYRTYEFLDYFRTFEFKDFLETYKNSSTHAANIYYWIISKTGENRLLPAITAFISYSCIFYVFRKTMEKYNISKQNFAMALFFYMAIGNYMFVITGIRTMLGISLVAFCFFRETVEKKFRLYHILIYIIAAFMHNLAVVVILIRLIVPLVSKSTSALRRMAYIMFFVAISAFIAFNMRELLDAVLERAERYINGEMYSYFWEYVIGAFVVVISLIALIKVRIKEYGEGELSQMKVFSLVCVILALALCFEFTTFHRLTTYVCAITATPLLMVYLDKRATKNEQTLFMFASAILLFITCARGSLCSLKFFVW